MVSSMHNYKAPIGDANIAAFRSALANYMDLTELGAVEDLLITALATGREVDFQEASDESGIQKQLRKPIDSEFFSWLLTNRDFHRYFYTNEITVKFAQFPSPLLLAQVNLPFSFLFVDCEFEGPLVLTNSSLKALMFSRCKIKEVKAYGATFGRLNICDSLVSKSEIFLVGAFITQNLVCENCELIAGESGKALSADFAEIGGKVLIGKNVTVAGELRFIGASIAGGLNIIESTVTNDGGFCLHVSGARLKGSLSIRDSRMYGLSDLSGTVIDQNLEIIGSYLGSKKASLETPWPEMYCLIAQTVIVNNTMMLEDSTLRDMADVSSAKIGILYDEAKSWPIKVEFGNFSVSEISFRSMIDAKARSEILFRAPQRGVLSVTPFIMFAKKMNEQGAEGEARKLMILYWSDRLSRGAYRILRRFKNSNHQVEEINEAWNSRDSRMDSEIEDSVGFLISLAIHGLVTGYGYSRVRAIWCLLVVWLVGAGVFGYSSDAFTQVESLSNSDRSRESGVVINNKYDGFWQGGPWAVRDTVKNRDQTFPSLLFSFDALIPVIDFGIAVRWEVISLSGASIYLIFHRISGWLIFSLLAISFTRIVRSF